MAHATEEFVAGPGDSLTVRTFPVFFSALELLLKAGVMTVAEAAFQDRAWRIGLESLTEIAELRVVRCAVPADLAFRRILQRGKDDPLRSSHAVHGSCHRQRLPADVAGSCGLRRRA